MFNSLLSLEIYKVKIPQITLKLTWVILFDTDTDTDTGDYIKLIHFRKLSSTWHVSVVCGVRVCVNASQTLHYHFIQSAVTKTDLGEPLFTSWFHLPQSYHSLPCLPVPPSSKHSIFSLPLIAPSPLFTAVSLPLSYLAFKFTPSSWLQSSSLSKSKPSLRFLQERKSNKLIANLVNYLFLHNYAASKHLKFHM